MPSQRQHISTLGSLPLETNPDSQSRDHWGWMLMLFSNVPSRQWRVSCCKNTDVEENMGHLGVSVLAVGLTELAVACQQVQVVLNMLSHPVKAVL